MIKSHLKKSKNNKKWFKHCFAMWTRFLKAYLLAAFDTNKSKLHITHLVQSLTKSHFDSIKANH